jgi:nucleotide-binding universal stress UspA family protein
MKKIKHILVPTDFSVTASNAFNYAKVLAEACGAEITVLHVSEFYLPASELIITPLTQIEDEKIAEAMENFVSEENSNSPTMVQAKVKTKIIKGDPVSRIVAFSKSDDVDIIVMGTTGLQDFISKIIGSISLDISNKALCPIVLVPRDAKWKPLDRIMFATTYEATAPKIVRKIADFSQIFGAKVDFVHIDDTPWDEDHDTDKLFDELFLAGSPDFSFEIHSIKKSDVVHGLRTYAERNGVNLIAFAHKHRNFWQNIVHHSITENMSISTDIPMMIMHFDDK